MVLRQQRKPVQIMSEYTDGIRSGRILRFMLAGGCSTALDFILYMALIQHMPVFISKGISMISASVFSYIVNKVFTFRSKRKSYGKYLVRFYIVFGMNLFVNTGMNWLLYRLTGIRMLSYIIATLAGMCVNYTGQKNYVFGETDVEISK